MNLNNLEHEEINQIRYKALAINLNDIVQHIICRFL